MPIGAAAQEETAQLQQIHSLVASHRIRPSFVHMTGLMCGYPSVLLCLVPRETGPSTPQIDPRKATRDQIPGATTPIHGVLHRGPTLRVSTCSADGHQTRSDSLIFHREMFHVKQGVRYRPGPARSTSTPPRANGTSRVAQAVLLPVPHLGARWQRLVHHRPLRWSNSSHEQQQPQLLERGSHRFGSTTASRQVADSFT